VTYDEKRINPMHETHTDDKLEAFIDESLGLQTTLSNTPPLTKPIQHEVLAVKPFTYITNIASDFLVLHIP
jgi:hypothetical protein